jgi:restriction endonuclease Mrr
MARADDPEVPAYIDEIHQDIAEFAARHLDPEEIDDFVDQLLERKGYQRQSIWAAPEPDGGGQGRRPLVKPAGQSGQRTGQRQASGQGRGSYFGGGKAR